MEPVGHDIRDFDAESTLQVSNDEGKINTNKQVEDASTASGPSEHGEEPWDDGNYAIDLLDDTASVTWTDPFGRAKSTQDLRLEVHVDCSKNQAFFSLRGSAYLKKVGANNKRTIFLFIYPENIQSIELDLDPSAPTSLETSRRSTFSMRFTTKSPPCLVIPKNGVLEVKKRSEELLSSMVALAGVTDFTVYSTLGLTTERRKQLGLVAEVFSHSRTLDHPTTDKNRGNIESLYQGAGGQIIGGKGPNVNDSAAPSSAPPVYDTVASSPERDPTALKSKRRHVSHTSDDYVEAGNYIIPILKRICSRLDTMDTRLETIDRRLDSMDRRFDGMGKRLDLLDQNTNPEACRYNTEEKEDMENAIADQVESAMLGARFDLEEAVIRNTDEIVDQRLSSARFQVSGMMRLDAEAGDE